MRALQNETELMAEHEEDKARKQYEQALLDNEEFDRKRAKEEASRLEYLAKQATERLERHRSRGFILKGIERMVVVRGHKCSIDIDNWKLMIDGIDATWWLRVDHVYHRISSWRSKQTAQLRIVTGSYGDRKSFPQKKAGDFSYDKIAGELLSRVWGKLEEEKRKRQMNRNANDVAILAAEFAPHITEYYRPFSASSRDDDKTVVVNLKEIYDPAITVTLEQARVIMTTLRSLGFKLSFNDKGDQN